MTIYKLELLFPEDMPKDLRESIEKILKAPPRPDLLNVDIWLHEEKLHYIPVIELTAIRGPYRAGEVKRVFEYLSSKVEVKRGRSQFEGSRHHHCFWPANVFELDEVKAEIEFAKSDSFLRLENEKDVKLVKELWLWDNCENTLQDMPEYKDKLDKMSEEEKNRAIWRLIIELVMLDILGYEKILNTYRKFNKLFWFTFYNPRF